SMYIGTSLRKQEEPSLIARGHRNVAVKQGHKYQAILWHGCRAERVHIVCKGGPPVFEYILNFCHPRDHSQQLDARIDQDCFSRRTPHGQIAASISDVVEAFLSECFNETLTFQFRCWIGATTVSRHDPSEYS